MLKTVLILGAGKIGRMIARLLTDSGAYQVRVSDVDQDALARLKERVPTAVTTSVDASSQAALSAAMQGCDAVISALSFRLNVTVAKAALEAGVSYFDLTEDIETTRAVRELASRARAGQVFIPQCGLAPGFIGIVASHLAQDFDDLDSVRMRVGALPQFPTNALKYNLTWSTDGLINEYCNPCEAIHGGRRIELLPLEGLEHFDLDGVGYEAFNTSGGLGTLCETLDGKVRELDYKTVRYPGHRALAAFLVNELRLSERRELLKDILEKSVPMTYQDVVIVFCTVTGWRKGRFVQKSEAKKIYRKTLDGELWSAIQITTAAAICAAVDLHVAGRLPQSGFVKQEDVDYGAFIANRFGRHYESESLQSSDAEPTE